jgi:hypothetical protein
MTFSVHGLPVARGIAIGRAVLMAGRVDVAHYFIKADQIARLLCCPIREAREWVYGDAPLAVLAAARKAG